VFYSTRMKAAEVRALVQSVVEAHPVFHNFYLAPNLTKDDKSEPPENSVGYLKPRAAGVTEDASRGPDRYQWVELWLYNVNASDRSAEECMAAMEMADEAACEIVQKLRDHGGAEFVREVTIHYEPDEGPSLRTGVLLRMKLNAALCVDLGVFQSPPGSVVNSDASYLLTVPSGAATPLPDVTHTDSDGAPVTLPGMVPFVATACDTPAPASTINGVPIPADADCDTVLDAINVVGGPYAGLYAPIGLADGQVIDEDPDHEVGKTYRFGEWVIYDHHFSSSHNWRHAQVTAGDFAVIATSSATFEPDPHQDPWAVDEWRLYGGSSELVPWAVEQATVGDLCPCEVVPTSEFANCESLANAVKVTGAGSAAANEVFVRDLTGFDTDYANAAYDTFLSVGENGPWGTGVWWTIYGGGASLYKAPYIEGEYPWEAVWELGPDGVGPVPTVTQATVSDACCVAPECADGSAVLKDTAGGTLSTTAVPSGAAVDIEAPNATAQLQNSAGGSLGNTAIRSGQSLPITAPDGEVSILTSTGVAVTDVAVLSGGTSFFVIPDPTCETLIDAAWVDHPVYGGLYSVDPEEMNRYVHPNGRFFTFEGRLWADESPVYVAGFAGSNYPWRWSDWGDDGGGAPLPEVRQATVADLGCVVCPTPEPVDLIANDEPFTTVPAGDTSFAFEVCDSEGDALEGLTFIGNKIITADIPVVVNGTTVGANTTGDPAHVIVKQGGVEVGSWDSENGVWLVPPCPDPEPVEWEIRDTEETTLYGGTINAGDPPLLQYIGTAAIGFNGGSKDLLIVAESSNDIEVVNDADDATLGAAFSGGKIRVTVPAPDPFQIDTAWAAGDADTIGRVLPSAYQGKTFNFTSQTGTNGTITVSVNNGSSFAAAPFTVGTAAVIFRRTTSTAEGSALFTEA
jgi:hypothetical protein